eukprot:CAMPEP_0184657570 /NCGR_PEP_ID=MMETSP0308-20130426/20304_1 /TAXON_ID=38269 /ORGANISM="Gloeochaete witrockiana, Strain SAG 46.84" /LENGTH=211 /DNA_ID=CAMNT_0027095541 /DNA_START=183 /DNA_END=818 /DNA_ORIENTATION=-
MPEDRSVQSFEGTLYLDADRLSFTDGTNNQSTICLIIPWGAIDDFAYFKTSFGRSRLRISHSRVPDRHGRSHFILSSHENTLALLAIIVSYLKATARQRMTTCRKIIESKGDHRPPNLALVAPHDKDILILCEPAPMDVDASAVLCMAQTALKREISEWPRLVDSCRERLYKHMSRHQILHAYISGAMVKLLLYKNESNDMGLGDVVTGGL